MPQEVLAKTRSIKELMLMDGHSKWEHFMLAFYAVEGRRELVRAFTTEYSL